MTHELYEIKKGIKIPTPKALEEGTRILTDGKNLIKVIKPLYYEIHGIVIVIPAGFHSDGPSNPFLQIRTTYGELVFGLIHDYGYRTQFYPVRIF